MIDLIIGTFTSGKIVDLTEKINKIEDNINSFTTADGKKHKCIIDKKNQLTVAYENLNDIEKEALINSVSIDVFNVTYNSISSQYCLECIPFNECYSDTNGNHWDITLTLEEY